MRCVHYDNLRGGTEYSVWMRYFEMFTYLHFG
jgi:hypothetical protein